MVRRGLAAAGATASNDKASAPPVTAAAMTRILRFRRMPIAFLIGTRRHYLQGKGEGGRVAVPRNLAPGLRNVESSTERTFGAWLVIHASAGSPVLAALAREDPRRPDSAGATRSR